MKDTSSLFMTKFTYFQSLNNYLITEKVVRRSNPSVFRILNTFVLYFAPGALIFLIYYYGKPI